MERDGEHGRRGELCVRFAEVLGRKSGFASERDAADPESCDFECESANRRHFVKVNFQTCDGILSNLDTLHAPTRALWAEPGGTPQTVTLYGGTALALRLGHRAPVIRFFLEFDPARLAQKSPILHTPSGCRQGPAR